MTPSYQLTVNAKDLYEPSFNANVSVIVTVIDENDNSPVWDSSLYTVSVPESAAIGTWLLNVHASDKDYGVYGLLVYSLLNYNDKFTVNSTTGAIAVSGIIDRAVNPYFIVDLEVRDSANVPFVSTSQLNVTVIDINDHSPIFTKSSYEASIPEIASKGTFVAQVWASDADIGTNAFITV